MPTKPHIVLVPGAWHTANAYHKIEPLLESARYKVTTLTLPCVGDSPPAKAFDQDVALINQTAREIMASGDDVILVLHSYAGIPGTEATKELAKQFQDAFEAGVVHLVYICAWMLREGESRNSAVGEAALKVNADRTRAVDGGVEFLKPFEVFYNDLPTEEAEFQASNLKLQSPDTFDAKLMYPAYMDIPATYLLCEQDQAIPYERQKRLVADARAAGAKLETVTCSAGHSPFLSQPELVANVIRRAAGEQMPL